MCKVGAPQGFEFPRGAPLLYVTLVIILLPISLVYPLRLV